MKCLILPLLALSAIASLILAAPAASAQSVPADTLYTQAPEEPISEEPAAFPAGTARSASDDVDDLHRQVDELQARLDEMERQQREAAPRVTLSGQIFGRYGLDASGTGGSRQSNSFAVNRLYFTAKGQLSDRFGFRATTDVVQATAEAGLGSVVVLKFAYLDWAPQSWVTLRAGVLQTGWTNYVTGRWGYRGVAKVMAHRQQHIGVADVGVTATAQLPSEFGRVSVGVLNGSGFRALETDQFKDIVAYASVTPFRNEAAALGPIELGAHAYAGHFDSGERRQRWGGLALYDPGPFRIGVNYEAKRDGDLEGHGVSTFGEIGLDAFGAPSGLAVLGLVDFYDPNRAAADDELRRTVVGLAYSPSRHLTVALDHQQVTTATAAFDRYDGDVTDTDAQVYLHLIVNY